MASAEHQAAPNRSPGTLPANSPAPDTARLELLRRTRGLYLEMPGLRLTAPQAARLLGAALPDCEVILAALVQGGFLVRSPNLTFGRAFDGPETSVA